MEPSVILYSSLTLGLSGLVMGLVLFYAYEKMAVPQDQLVTQLAEALPQVNCGGCGFPGCAGYAQAIANKNASLNLCAPGGEETVWALLCQM